MNKLSKFKIIEESFLLIEKIGWEEFSIQKFTDFNKYKISEVTNLINNKIKKIITIVYEMPEFFLFLLNFLTSLQCVPKSLIFDISLDFSIKEPKSYLFNSSFPLKYLGV